jgi:hypothetical protein
MKEEVVEERRSVAYVVGSYADANMRADRRQAFRWQRRVITTAVYSSTNHGKGAAAHDETRRLLTTDRLVAGSEQT